MTPARVVAGLEVPANVLVTGASSGIGLAAVEQLLDNARVGRVVALSRGADHHDGLSKLGRAHGDRLRTLSCDITSDADRATLVARLAAAGVDRLHLLLNCAGVLHANGVVPEKSLAALRGDALARVFALNAFAPILLVQALLPLLKYGDPVVLASLSARVGSIGDNHLGGWYAYRASKAAQNQMFRTLSIEMRRTHPHVACVLLHPGTVDTPLSKPFQAGVPPGKLFSAEHSAQRLLLVIAGITPEDSGRFYAWDGAEIPW
ncbi:MAG: SDR family NAD(P)-dependent oxidoreductase [Luteimonas sp.]